MRKSTSKDIRVVEKTFNPNMLRQVFEKNYFADGMKVCIQELDDKTDASANSIGRYHEFINQFLTHWGFDHDLKLLMTCADGSNSPSESPIWFPGVCSIYARFAPISLESTLVTGISVRRVMKHLKYWDTRPTDDDLMEEMRLYGNGSKANIINEIANYPQNCMLSELNEVRAIRGLTKLYEQESINLDSMIVVYYTKQ